jgi:uncharacterized protein
MASVPTEYGEVVRDEVIPAKEFLGLPLDRGQVLRIIDVEGKQVPDLVCFNRHDPSERLSCNNSRLVERRWLLTTGHTLISDEGNTMMTITDDTVGVHHASGGCCNEPANFLRYGIRGTRNCLDNLTQASAPIGVDKKQIPGAFCPFMRVVQQEDGSYEIQEPTSRAGDYIDLRAEMDLWASISNCPQDRNPCNGFNPTPLRIVVYGTKI